MRTLYNTDNEVMFREDVSYTNKPFLGVLITNNSQKYVIPLTSAKPKHRFWPDSNKGFYRIYEIIDIRTTPYDSEDIMVDITNNTILTNRKIAENEIKYFKKRILSVLEIRKMIPVIDGVYSIVDLSTDNLDISHKKVLRRNLLYKEYIFCKKIKDGILTKASKIYNKQMKTGKVLKYHCNYKALEQVAKKLFIKSSTLYYLFKRYCFFIYNVYIIVIYMNGISD